MLCQCLNCFYDVSEMFDLTHVAANVLDRHFLLHGILWYYYMHE